MYDATVKQWYRRMYECEAAWERAKARYSEVRGSYTQGLEHDPAGMALALDRAGSDQRLKDAVKDTKYYREEMVAYGQLIQTWYAANRKA